MDLLKTAEKEVAAGKCDFVGYTILSGDNPRTELERMKPEEFDLFMMMDSNEFVYLMRKIKLHDRALGGSISTVRVSQLTAMIQDEKNGSENGPGK